MMAPTGCCRRSGCAGLSPSQEWAHSRTGTSDFAIGQVGLLDAMLATQPQADCDTTFTHLCEELRRFQGVEAAEQPAGFVGQLREYQREGLGWMRFLRRFWFGGCL